MLQENNEDLIGECCIDDPFVKEAIRSDGEVGVCSSCDSEGMCITMSALARLVDPVFQRNYEQAREEAHFPEDSDNVEYYAEGEDATSIIESMLGTSREIAEQVEQILKDTEDVDIKHGEEAFYGFYGGYEQTGVDDYSFRESWLAFKHAIRHRARFFNDFALDCLKEIFHGVEGHGRSDGKPIIYQIGPGSEIESVFRARQVMNKLQRDKILKNPSKKLGPPPRSIAKPGRMSAAGVVAFYGALEEDTCIAELRLPIGDAAIVGRFQILKPLTVFDFTRFDAAHDSLSMFDPEFNRLLGHWQFLRSLSEEISRPVLPHEEELDYLATQAVAEYLSNIHTPRIDAVIYSSAQTKHGRNIVLFNHAAIVARWPELPGVIDIWEGEGYLHVTFGNEGQPQTMVGTNVKAPSNLGDDPYDYNGGDEPYLDLVRDSLKLIKAESISYELDTHSIGFYDGTTR